jgi:hypothetical protein
MAGPAATRASPAALLAALEANRLACPFARHHQLALTARSFAHLLTGCDLWVLDSIVRLPGLSERQWLKLRQIESKVERLRP